MLRISDLQDWLTLNASPNSKYGVVGFGSVDYYGGGCITKGKTTQAWTAVGLLVLHRYRGVVAWTLGVWQRLFAARKNGFRNYSFWL